MAHSIKLTLIWMFALTLISTPGHAWSNGGYSAEPGNPIQGTHDLMLEKAINMLPLTMQARINTTVASYGTELPDCKTGIYCIGDTTKHHVYYRANGSLQDNASAVRARQEYDLARSYLDINDTYNFSLHLGAMSHYISDLAVFGHTMGASTDWGTEVHHDDYESYVDNHPDYFFNNVSFDGSYENLSAYNATLKLANETTFDEGTYTNVWMDHNYNWSNPVYKSITQAKINYTINLLADDFYTLVSSAAPASDLISYYRSLGSNRNVLETTDILKAADDWSSDTAPSGFAEPVTTQQLLALADEWSGS